MPESPSYLTEPLDFWRIYLPAPLALVVACIRMRTVRKLFSDAFQVASDGHILFRFFQKSGLKPPELIVGKAGRASQLSSTTRRPPESGQPLNNVSDGIARPSNLVCTEVAS